MQSKMFPVVAGIPNDSSYRSRIRPQEATAFVPLSEWFWMTDLYLPKKETTCTADSGPDSV